MTETSTVMQAGSALQGTQLHGMIAQGSNVSGLAMHGFKFSGATKNGSALSNVRVVNGELLAEQGQTTLSGSDFYDAHLLAEWWNTGVTPTATATVEYKVTAVQAETSYDPTNTGSTYLYTLEQNVDDASDWQPACPLDADSRRVAIPLVATWDQQGNRVASNDLFTLGCTTGVLAKCYRWGYRPWVTSYGDLVSAHWTCTRLARADYCGNGTSHTHDGTEINLWDNLPSPGPIQSRGTTPLLMFFEAGWNTSGAVCLSHARWLLGGNLIAQHCPNRLIAPGPLVLGATVCDTVADVLGLGSSSQMFNDSNLNLNLDLL
ncbi:MAG: hypothetical protein E6J91_16200 [Deltaproteobacteria bacterium]|nr:MAG: hypothetical protein E6J91_16200 [Deltaproteobacteria bacterium]